MTISGIVITKNESGTVERCLSSLQWCTEVLVIDTGSEDDTIDVARRQGVVVHLFPFQGDFSALRNFGLEKAQGEWVFFVDADEVVSEDLQSEILKAVNENNLDGFFLKRQDAMWGKLLRFGDSGNTKLVRLGRKGKGKWRGRVHEVWELHGKVGSLHSPLFHFPHPSVESFVRRINFYSDIRAAELFQQHIESSVLEIILYPKAKFFINYIVKLGFLDGMPGMVHACIMSMYSFLVRAKLWVLWQKKVSG